MKIIILLLLFVQATWANSFSWPTSTPEKEGISEENINQAIKLIESGEYGQIKSLVIIKNGKLITEKHFSNFGTKAPIYSVTKSIGAVLLGIAKYQGGKIDINQSIMSYMPQYNDIEDFENKNLIKVKDLLNQRHGLAWDEWTLPYENPGNPVTMMLQTQDWYRTVLEWPIAFTADKDFAYSTGASSLMSVILNNVTNQTPQEFIEENLYQPLDINDHHWELTQANGTIGQGLAIFPSNLAPLGHGIWLKPIDMAKIGELVRTGGIWQGQRLLSEDWIKKFTTSNSDGVTDPDIFGGSNSGHSYQWWQQDFKDSLGRTFQSHYADGYGRQHIFVFPQANMVVVSTASDYDSQTSSPRGIGSLLRNQILPGVIDGPQGNYPITDELNASWYWPENSGQGFNIEVIGDSGRAIAYWYTYDENKKQRWFLMQGEIENDVAKFIIYSTNNGSFVYSDPANLINWGTGEMFFYNCRLASFSFISELERVSATIPLTRLSGTCNEGKNKRINENIILP